MFIKKKMLPGALLWDYEKLLNVGRVKGSWLILYFFFFCPMLPGSVLYWAGSFILLPVPRKQGALFLLPIKSRCRLTGIVKILILYSGPFLRLHNVIGDLHTKLSGCMGMHKHRLAKTV